MLILTRKIGESIIIEDNIEVKILHIQRKKVKLGIRAPFDVSINRKEIYEAIKKENLASSKAPKGVDKLISILPTTDTLADSS